MNVPAPDTMQLFWLLLLVFVVAILSRRFRAPYAVVLVVTGLLVGVPQLLPHVRLEPRTLFTLLLPPLLFEAAIHLPAEALRRDWLPISVLAFAGTLISTAIVGAITAWLLHVPLAVGLLFGALISATDPTSVLGIFKRLRAQRRLTRIVEAESLFNDGVAVVLFGVTLAAATRGNVSWLAGVQSFLVTVAGGVAVGLGVGFLASRVHLEVDDHLVEITLTTVVAYGSFLAAQALGVSGVVAVLAAGLVVGNYGMQRAMSPGTRLAVSSFWEYAAFVVNSLIFLLVGIEAGLVRWWDRWLLALGAVGAVLLGRAAVYPLSWLLNRLGASIPITWQHVVFWGGLRGALSLALALGLPPGLARREALVACTFGVVLFSLLAQGLTIGPLLKRLGLATTETPQTEYHRLASEAMACEAALRELEEHWVAGRHPTWAIKTLAERYQARLAELTQAIEALEMTGGSREEERGRHVRRLAVLAEKSVLQDAERRGWLDEEEWKRLTARIDEELAGLAAEREG
jgi:CPA1 family monovalent cation:H+ antiporter